MIVGTWCRDVWWGVRIFGEWDRRLQEADGRSRKTDGIKFFGIYDCACSHNGSAWCGREDAVPWAI